MKPVVLAVSGQIASGKSTLALRLVEELNCARASFGDFVRTIAMERGMEPNRENLQSIGAELIALGWEPFCRAVLAHSNWKTGQLLVVDGVRHSEAVHELRKLVAPLRVFLIYLTVDDELRRGRLNERGNAYGAASVDNEAHPTESQVRGTLPNLADLLLDGTKPADALALEVSAFLARIP